MYEIPVIFERIVFLSSAKDWGTEIDKLCDARERPQDVCYGRIERDGAWGRSGTCEHTCIMTINGASNLPQDNNNRHQNVLIALVKPSATSLQKL